MFKRFKFLIAFSLAFTLMPFYAISAETNKAIVTDQTELEDALADPTIEEVMLKNDINVIVTTPNALHIDREITLDGNGKTLNGTVIGGGHLLKISHNANDGTIVKNLTIKSTDATTAVIYVSTAKGVYLENNTIESTDNKAMGLYFDEYTSGVVLENSITGRKGVGTDKPEGITIKNNDIFFCKLGIEIITEKGTLVINNKTEEPEENQHYFVLDNTYINNESATNAVEKAEKSKLQSDVDIAMKFTNGLSCEGSEDIKANLLDRLEIVQEEIDALGEVEEPEVNPTEPEVDPTEPEVDPTEPEVKPEVKPVEKSKVPNTGIYTGAMEAFATATVAAAALFVLKKRK